MASNTPQDTQCQYCKESETKLVEVTEKLEISSAQTSHYEARILELTSELQQAKVQIKQLSNGFNFSTLDSRDPSLFMDESLERIMEWQECLKLCAEEKMLEEEYEFRDKKKGEMMEGEGGKRKAKKEKEETLLPFSQLGLSGYLTKNHRLTQNYTEYPTAKPE